MTDSSDKEDDQTRNDGGASPRTLLAIQQALAEEDDHLVEQAAVIRESPANTQINIHHPGPQVVLSSSDEEPEPETVKSLPQENLDLKRNKANQSLNVKDGLFASSSEDEKDEVIGQRNSDLHHAPSQPRRQRGMKSNDGSNKAQLSADMRCGQMEKRQELEEKVTLSTPVCAQPQDAGAATCEQRSPRSTEAPEKTDVNSETSEESESEGRYFSLYQRKGGGSTFNV